MFKNIKISVLLLLLSSSLSPLIFAKDAKAHCTWRHTHHCIPKPIRNTPFDPNTWNPVDWVKSGAGELCEANATTTAWRNRNNKQGLHPIQKQYLRPYFGNLVDEVTVKWDSQLNDKWTFKGRTVQLGSAGQAYGNTIYIANKKQPTSTAQLVLLAHEFRHVLQYRGHGNLDNFCREYMTAYAKGGFNYENNSYERDAYNFEYKFASELKSKLLPTKYKYTLTFPSYIKRSAIVLPTELPIKNAYFIHNKTVFYTSTGNSHCAFLKPKPHAEHLRRNKNYIELGIQNPSKFGKLTGKCKELPIKNAYFIHNNIVFYTSTGTNHCAFLKPEPYAEHLRKNKNYLELGIQNPLKFGKFTGKCPKI